jgi:uncharacterized protein YndB with AHSA1/START domain
MSRAFEITREVDLPASPDDVWTAITADTAAWQFPTGLEVPADGGPPANVPVETWEPPHRLVIRIQSPDGTFNALDYTIEARAGGTAHLRYVHSGILADGWEDQYDAIGGHTDFYLATLAEYLEHFNGRPVTYVGQPSAGIEGPETAGDPDAMDTLRAALGLSADARAGDRVEASLGDAGTLDGVVDYATPEFLGVRTADGLYRFFGRNHYGSVVGMSAHLFAGAVDAAAHEAALKAWLDGVYAPQRVR